MSGNPTGRAAWVLVLAALGGPVAADDDRGGEVGVVLGAFAPDQEMTGDSGTTELSVGLRGGSTFGRHVGWFIDGLYSEVGTRNGLGDGNTIIGRTGLDWLFSPERDARWLLSAGVGWMAVDFDNGAVQDFHNPLASLGFGQRIRIGEKMRLRWELRGDTTLDDARLADDLVQGHALLALTWGPGGQPSGRARVDDDADRDGVADRRDRCPQTPAGATVNKQGCHADDDRDGVPNGVDRCPGSRALERVGPDGCAADEDGDGVADLTDTCPTTPAGALVDEWGCPKDQDRDQVFDGLDRCPDTPAGARVDASGCPSDGDEDGVLDGIDRCPDSPVGTQVGPAGCALDTDGDGVADSQDTCPGTRAGTRVDARGCAAAAPLFEEGRSELVLRDVRFETNSATLTPDSLAVLDRVAESLAGHADVRVEVAGYTDGDGDDEYNLELSRRRAETVRDYLVLRGIDAARLVARGYGETRPVGDDDTPEGRAANRRVELKKL